MSARHRRARREQRESEAAEHARQERIRRAAPDVLAALELMLAATTAQDSGTIVRRQAEAAVAAVAAARGVA